MSGIPLTPVPSTLSSTTNALHAVAEQVLVPFLYGYDKKIGLRSLDADRFGTAPQADGKQAWIEGDMLCLQISSQTQRQPLTTLQAAAEFLGVAPGLPAGIYKPTTSSIAADTTLSVDAAAGHWLSNWYSVAVTALTNAASQLRFPDAQPILWPEHFDIAIDAPATGLQATIGASPADADHAEPYLYVTPWTKQPAGSDFDDPFFPGASMLASELTILDDPTQAAADFFVTKFQAITH